MNANDNRRPGSPFGILIRDMAIALTNDEREYRPISWDLAVKSPGAHERAERRAPEITITLRREPEIGMVNLEDIKI